MASTQLMLRFIAFTALFSALTSASCNSDNCLRALRGSASSAAVFCSSYTTNPMVLPTIPAFASPCSSSSSSLSSACSCLATTTAPTSSVSTTTPPVTTPTTCPTVTITPSCSTCSPVTITSSSSCPPPTSPSQCPTIPPPSTVTVTSVTTVSASCSSSTSAAPPCSCTNLLGNPSFENSTPAPWQIINNDPGARVSLAPSADIPDPYGAYDGNWALQFAWEAGTIPENDVGIYQSVPIPPCCIGPTVDLSWAILIPSNTCTFRIFWNVITPAQPDDTIHSTADATYTFEPNSEWQEFDITWQFQAQQGFRVEIMLACSNSDTVWLDFVGLNAI